MNFHQTLSTLRFATRAKTVHNAPTLNEILDDNITINQYKSEIVKLRQELKRTQNELDGLNSYNSDLKRQLRSAFDSAREIGSSDELGKLSRFEEDYGDSENRSIEARYREL